jgi:hypothetical protein
MMTSFDRPDSALSTLFMRIDAARPTDAALQPAADLWSEKRKGKVMPAPGDFADMPPQIERHVFQAHLAINGDEHWIVTSAGEVAERLLQIEGDTPAEVPDKRMAVRLRRLFELVAERGEPYAVTCEASDNNDRKQLIEIYAAPLATAERKEHAIFGAINSRPELG